MRQAPIPTERAVLWLPQGGTVAAPVQFPVFFGQSTLRAINEHFRASPESGLLGFLTGDLCEDAATHARFVVVDSTIRLTQPIYGDKTTVVVSRVMERVQKELAKTNGAVIGWYHSHPPLGLSLAAGDLETHVTFFGKAWHVALVLGGTADQPAAALFRSPRNEPTALVALPFYELIDERETAAPGGKVSHMPWRNFRTADRAATRGASAAVPAPRASQVRGSAPAERSTLEVTAAPPPPPPPAPRPAATMSPPVARAGPPETAGLPLMELGAPMPDVPAPRAPRASGPPAPPPARRTTTPARPSAPPPAPRTSDPRRRTSRPVVRASLSEAQRRGGSGRGWIWGVLLVLGLGAGGAYYYLRLRPGAAGHAATVPPATAVGDSALHGFERVSDTMTGTVRSYNDRARLFDNRQMTCTDLARGVVAVENGWTTYNLRRKALTGPLDAVHAGRDQAVYAAVDSVERHFDRSRCARP